MYCIYSSLHNICHIAVIGGGLNCGSIQHVSIAGSSRSGICLTNAFENPHMPMKLIKRSVELNLKHI